MPALRSFLKRHLRTLLNLYPPFLGAAIRFRRPGRGTVFAGLRISAQQLDEIRHALRSEEKIDRTFAVEVKDRSGVVVAEVSKQLHIRRKAPAYRSSSSTS